MITIGKSHRIGWITGGLMMLAAAPLQALDIHTEILIEAEPEIVWATLADLENYSVWNPYHVEIGGDLEAGKRLDLVIHKPKGKVIKLRPRVRRVLANKVLVWGGGVPLVFTGNHVFELEEVSKGCTRLVQREQFSGILVPFLDLSGVEIGYAEMNASLKAHIETKHAHPNERDC